MVEKVVVRCPQCGRFNGTSAVYSSRCPFCGKNVNHNAAGVVKRSIPENLTVADAVRILNGGEDYEKGS